ncbi:alanine racemase [Desulfosporosinus sp. BICA1-9]|uniref:alanine racemase n=1 Tax=Desulfosporosinus sp. BICA1-9 TaxID=1531958 RepID=UPI0005F1DEDB|nr:alanine racemase [Desulfosporosinus sp. BICA1-9]KJS48233.1 MAG: alanine racemase [Peptococcaceae bacterium BRH_c23]KJS83294.1 MAG: alanine racemase [Desulfosporosinus sp. BICA1-9]HBW38205.1 alanine racemase [Desulfosporosinus sp.]
MGRQVWAEVNLQTLRENYFKLKAYTQSEMMPIVKADAYGHGLIPVVKTLKGCGAERYGVALLEEALEIKAVFPELTVMVLGVTELEDSDSLVKEEIIPAISRLAQAKALSEAALRLKRTARVHIKVDTGMGRIGFREEDYKDILKIADLPNLKIEGIFTHFATSDHKDLSFARIQLKSFQSFCDKLKELGLTIPIQHTANSAALIQFPESHLDLVRAGISLYGFTPSSQLGEVAGLEPVMSWKAKVTHIKTIETGETVSYGRTFQAAYPTRVATIPLGYADGLRRGLSNHGEMLVHGKRSTVIGRICMDQTMLDVTRIPRVQVGDVVTILGKDDYEQITATEMAKWLGTISYEVVCGISKRVPRVYLGLAEDALGQSLELSEPNSKTL